MKPLSLGFYWTQGEARAVYTSELDAVVAAQQVDFGAAPFMAQEMVRAERHFRVW